MAFVDQVIIFVTSALHVYLPLVAGNIRSAYIFIFPEYPSIGPYIFGFGLLLFVVYWVKAGFMQGFKIGFYFIVGLTLLLFVLHHLSKLLHLNTMVHAIMP